MTSWERKYEAYKAIWEKLGALIRALDILTRLAIDSAGRLKVMIDAAGTATPVTQSGAWASPSYSQGSQPFQLSNLEYYEQRNKMTFG